MSGSAERSPTASDDTQTLHVLNWISSQTGLSFRSQEQHARQILRRIMAQADDAGPMDCIKRLKENTAAFDEVVADLTVGETYFFRDEFQFRIIRDDFVRQITTTRPTNHPIRLWSAGCASGEEAWSLVIVMAEAGLQDRSHVLGTDISRPLLARAQTGIYRAWSLRGGAANRLENWAEPTDGACRITDRLRQTVTFKYLNLAEENYPSYVAKTAGFDLILCRNVLIYFDVLTIERVAKQLFQCLAPGGWLITGASDPPLIRFAPFQTVVTDSGIVLMRPDLNSSSNSSTNTPSSLRVSTGKEVPTDRLSRHSLSLERGVKSRGVKSSATESGNVQGQTGPSGQIAEKHPKAGRNADVQRPVAVSKDDLPSSVQRVRALANADIRVAEESCREASIQHSTSVELHYLHAILLTELTRYAEAVEAARRVLFLDRELVVGHMALGTSLVHIGDIKGARRSFRNAERICRRMPPGQIVPLSEGEHAGRMAESASQHLSLLNASTADPL